MFFAGGIRKAACEGYRRSRNWRMGRRVVLSGTVLRLSDDTLLNDNSSSPSRIGALYVYNICENTLSLEICQASCKRTPPPIVTAGGSKRTRRLRNRLVVI